MNGKASYGTSTQNTLKSYNYDIPENMTDLKRQLAE